ncbi:MAG: IPT/TIG domain-containing protein [Polyangiaceae bacterium]|nr:IPT/TIG domain-containing protein [Polyangiaceae bacterium]
MSHHDEPKPSHEGAPVAMAPEPSTDHHEGAASPPEPAGLPDQAPTAAGDPEPTEDATGDATGDAGGLAPPPMVESDHVADRVADQEGAGGEEPASAPAPTLGIASLEPTSGPRRGGTELVIRGSCFGPDCRVSFGGLPVASALVSDQELRITVPPFAEAEFADLRVDRPTGEEALWVNGFRYDPDPTVERLVPGSAPPAGGTTVFLLGSGLRAGCEVRIGGSFPLVRWLSSSRLELETVSHPAGEYDVTVTNADGSSAVTSLGFRFEGEPEVSGVEPARGPLAGGTEIQIRGRRFARGAAVYLGEDPSPLLSAHVSSEELRALTPRAVAAGPQRLRVENPDGSSGELAKGFRYDAGPAPVVARVSPSTVPLVGGPIRIEGDHFSEPCEVVVAGHRVFAKRVSDRELTASAPPVPHGGAAIVEVLNSDGQSHSFAQAFFYVALRAPTVVALDPAVGTLGGGYPVTITGSEFASGCTVRFGTAQARCELVSASQLIAHAPRYASPGRVPVEVSNPDGQAFTLADGFTFEAGPVPRITDVYPREGKATGGTRLTIEGRHFAAGTQVSLGGMRAAQVVVKGPTELEVITPGGRPGMVDIVVTAPDGSRCEQLKAFQYHRAEAPTIGSVAPNRGAVDGGTEIDVSGTGFVEGTVVLVDGQPAKPSRGGDARTLVVLTPKGKAGHMVDVAVRNPDGQVATAKRAFLYDPRSR